MKNIASFKALAASAIALTALLSCQKQEKYDWSILQPTATVTVKPTGDGSFYMQLDDNTTLVATNVGKSPFGDREVRAILNFSEENAPHDGFSKAVKVHWMDSILTKNTVQAAGEDGVAEYGSDPVEIFNDWITYVEDGYFTIHFTTVWGRRNVKHSVNLATGTNPDDPYEIVFCHDAFGDTCGEYHDGIAAFRLSELPDTNGETVKLTLKWNSFSGEKKAVFDYRTRQDRGN